MEMYVKPEVELIQYDLRDVISTSGGDDNCEIYHDWCHTEGSYSCPFGDRP